MELTSVQQMAGRPAFATAPRPRSAAVTGQPVAASGSWQLGAKASAMQAAISSIDLTTKPATHMYVDANHRVRRLREPSP